MHIAEMSILVSVPGGLTIREGMYIAEELANTGRRNEVHLRHYTKGPSNNIMYKEPSLDGGCLANCSKGMMAWPSCTVQ